MLENSDQKVVVIIGAGPAGLTAVYELCKMGVKNIVLEKDSVVGGLARTVYYKGYRFDIGGHRFFTKIKDVEKMWKEVLREDFLTCNRLSRIYYKKRFFFYPLRPTNALSGLGVLESFFIILSYLKALLFPIRPEKSFEEWIRNRFGRRLYKIFFKTYTEKVWGISCNEISAEWAAQRIKGLSLLTALKNSLITRQTNHNDSVIRTLTNTFNYPKYGTGMMWETVATIVQQKGTDLQLNARIEKIHWSNRRLQEIEVNANGNRELVRGTYFISSMPIRELIQKFEPSVPAEILQAANNLKYRDFLIIGLIINKKDVFPDNWIYIHDPNVRVGRIQNFKNWSPHMVPDPNKTSLELEYFCSEGNDLWLMSDQALIELGKHELEKLNLVRAQDVEDGVVIRVAKAYPVYDSTYRKSLQVIRGFLSQFDNLQLVGRNGMHKYNNQDHSMLTAMLAVKNILGAHYDLWEVNMDQEYHEEITGHEEKDNDEITLLSLTQPYVPLRTT